MITICEAAPQVERPNLVRMRAVEFHAPKHFLLHGFRLYTRGELSPRRTIQSTLLFIFMVLPQVQLTYSSQTTIIFHSVTNPRCITRNQNLRAYFKESGCLMQKSLLINYPFGQTSAGGVKYWFTR